MKEFFHSATAGVSGAIPVQVSTGRNWEHDNNADVCKKAVILDFFLSSGRNLSTEFHDDSKDCRYRSFRSINLRSFIIFVLEVEIQKSGKFSFRFSLGSYVMDQRNGDGRFRMNFDRRDQLKVRISRILKCWTREMFLLTSSKRTVWRNIKLRKRNVSTRKTDRSHDLWLLSSHWRWWYGSWSRWLSLSLFVTTMFRTSTRDAMNFCCQWPKSHRMMFWKVSTNKDTWLRSTQNRIRIVQHGNSSENIETWLSKDDEERFGSETPIANFLT